MATPTRARLMQAPAPTAPPQAAPRKETPARVLEWRPDYKFAEYLVQENYGIPLEWGERAILRLYTKCFERRGMDYITASAEAASHFMEDHFGLDELALSAIEDPRTHRKIGSDMLRRPEFKEYCIRHAAQWRDEHDMCLDEPDKPFGRPHDGGQH